MRANALMWKQILDGDYQGIREDGFYNITDIVNAGNAWRISQDLHTINLSAYLKGKRTVAFFKNLEKKHGGQVIITSSNRSEKTWAHPLIAIDILTQLDENLVLKNYQWIVDILDKYKGNKVTSYEAMCGFLYVYSSNKTTFLEDINFVYEQLKQKLNIKFWEQATEEDLETKRLLEKAIIDYCGVLKNSEEAIKMAFFKIFPNS